MEKNRAYERVAMLVGRAREVPSRKVTFKLRGQPGPGWLRDLLPFLAVPQIPGEERWMRSNSGHESPLRGGL